MQIDLPAGAALLARWVVPVATEPIENGIVEIAHGKITAIRKRRPSDVVVDLGDVAILPGLINAHTHCEFGELKEPLGAPGMSFADWIPQVIAYRRRLELNDDGSPRDPAIWRRAGVAASLADMENSGVAAIGEIATDPWPSGLFRQSSLAGTIFLELLGLAPEREAGLLTRAKEHLLSPPPQAGQRMGLSPHAPYTVSLTAVQKLGQLAKQHDAAVAMHLAESPDEMEMLRSHGGKLVEMLSSRGFWYGEQVSKNGVQPYLDALATAPQSLVIHGNYLETSHWDFVAQRADRMTVVYCPRTAARFIDRRYPLAEMLRAGVPMAVGTDSRASNPDLSISEELKTIHALHPDVSPSDILKMGTIVGSKALRLESQLGVLSQGYAASFAVIRNLGTTGDSVLESLLAPSAKAEGLNLKPGA
jgi:cytosine/adenosine deaminase-related metal-dependent hydrolase